LLLLVVSIGWDGTFPCCVWAKALKRRSLAAYVETATVKTMADHLIYPGSLELTKAFTDGAGITHSCEALRGTVEAPEKAMKGAK
jgi:hypothetical protein